MEWVETTAKTIEAAREAALDRLGVAADDAEFDVVEEPRPGLFGRVRGQARVRARIRPTPVRPKQERRRKGGRDKGRGGESTRGGRPRDERGDQDDRGDDGGGDRGGDQGKPGRGGSGPGERQDPGRDGETGDDRGGDRNRDERSAAAASNGGDGRARTPRKRPSRSGRASAASRTTSTDEHNEEQPMNDTDDRPSSDVSPEEVGAAAVVFMTGLTDAFGVEATSELAVDGLELSVDVTGSELGLLVGPGGRTLSAIQDLARVAAQRRLGDHDTRLRIDVARYRERRNAALERFALEVAESVRSTGSARSLEPMSSTDRKVIHDVLNGQEGVASRSEGEDPNRRIVVIPA